MKTKNKILALVEIAVLLCSVFLVTILVPTIAAGQDDDVLGIYGNANLDDCINMRDYTYTARIICWLEDETDLADANYDGRISVADMTQIGLIILGRESELTIEQYAIHGQTFKPVTINKPIERIVVQGIYGAEALCALEVHDRIAGVSESIKTAGQLKTFVEDKTSFGSDIIWDVEKILELMPDFVLVSCCGYFPDEEEKLKSAGIPLIRMYFYEDFIYSEIRNLGWILSKKERAEEIINFDQSNLNIIKERVEDLKPVEKTRVYYEYIFDYSSVGVGTKHDNAIIKSGGINIFADLSGHSSTVSSEEVLERNPQVILKLMSTGYNVPSGYNVVDTGEMEELRNNIMSRPGWGNIDAVKNGRVYLISSDTLVPHYSVYYSYVAKWLHPELFADVDSVDIHRDWFETFLGVEYRGVYAYPTYPV